MTSNSSVVPLRQPNEIEDGGPVATELKVRFTLPPR